MCHIGYVPAMQAHAPALPRISLTRISLAIIVLGCLALVGAYLQGYAGAPVIAKLSASTGFVVLALAQGALASRYGKFILAGLVLSWFGDAFLLGSSATLFLLGLIAFLLGHVAYVAAFQAHGFDRRWTLVAGLPIAVASAAALAWLDPYLPESMVVPVWAYLLVISTMVAFAIGTRGAGGTLLIPLGAVLFYGSDLSVAAGQFVKPDFPNYVWGLPAYFAGQALLALSVASKRPD